jgi:folate-dependent phosphoribosylglycinamide formyltransferase PurN
MGKWIAFFSQTGNEIAEVSNHLDRWPDVIITNERPARLRKINQEVLSKNIITLPNQPTVEDYRSVLAEAIGIDTYVITLHGWLRVIPTEVIEEYSTIYNGHPGLITKYPELKGKDPQMKAWNLDLSSSGCVIHQVTAGVDDGPVVRSQQISIRNLTMDEMFQKLHNISVDMWVNFLKRHWL